MKRLHYRLSIAMLAIVVVLGGAFYHVDRYSVQMYYEELSQRLNASLAMYIVNAEPLITHGVVNRDALSELANRAMVINPTAEIYLLAPDGRILGHALPPDEVVIDHVDVGPIRKLLSGSHALPVKGTDPRNPGVTKVFSSFPVTDPAKPDDVAGYLYVVLGGSRYEAVADQVSGSDKQRVVIAAIVLLVVAAIVAGTSLFSFLTRRLRRLTADVSRFTENKFETDLPVATAGPPRDEIDQLRNACNAMAKALNQQLSSVRENDRLRRELVTNISHDLRTPLATMQGYVETLLIKDDELKPETRRRYLEVARNHAAHLGKLIQDLFELAMLDSSRMTPEFENFSLTELIHDVVQEFGLQAEESKVAICVDPPDETISVYADISLIQRVLENLVGNALRYTPEGGMVSITVRPASAVVGVSVEDTGAGIPAEDLPHIFDRFYKAGAEDSGGNESVGLGLAIARRILELHGSEIRVVSKEHHGTRFQFNLPLQSLAA